MPYDGRIQEHDSFAITARELTAYRAAVYRSVARALLRLPDPLPPAVLDIIRALELGALL